MFNKLFVLLLFICAYSANVTASNNNPFSRTDSVKIGSDIRWVINHKSELATKSVTDGKGTYYHLQYDNRQLSLYITTDASGLSPKQFTQLEVKDVLIDGKQSPLFLWCLNNQDSHDRFLQQGLSVKKNICSVDGNNGKFNMQLNMETLSTLQNGNQLLIILKPYRTPVELHYDLADFNEMYHALNAQPVPVVIVEQQAKEIVEKPKKKCLSSPPARYKNIEPVEYLCDDDSAKQAAEMQLAKMIEKENARQRELEAEKDKQRKLAEQKKQKELEEKLKQEEKLKAEAVAIAASEAKRAQIKDEITQKMLAVCEKYWSKGEHRCYCQNYIEYAPAEIQAKANCN